MIIEADLSYIMQLLVEGLHESEIINVSIYPLGTNTNALELLGEDVDQLVYVLVVHLMHAIIKPCVGEAPIVLAKQIPQQGLLIGEVGDVCEVSPGNAQLATVIKPVSWRSSADINKGLSMLLAVGD